MHSLAKKFMMARKLDFGEKGRAQLLDDTVFMMDGSLLPQVIERAGSEAAYEIGAAVGEALADNAGKTGISGTKMDEFMMDLLTMMGLGEFEVHEFDINTKEGEVRVGDCVVSRKGGSTDCSITAGIIAGVFEQNYGNGVEVEEVGCVLEGDDICRFRLQS